METQFGWNLSPNDFHEGFERFDDIVYYDGPLLSHYTSPGGGPFHYLFKWIDQDETYDRWLVMETSINDLYDYLTNSASLKNIIEKDYNNKIYVADANENGDFNQALLVKRADLLSKYYPKEESYYGLSMSDEYASYFEEVAKHEVPFARYLASQRLQPLRLRLAPVGYQHATTVGAAEIGSFLQRITKSFRAYVGVRFEALFSAMFALEEQAAKALAQLLEEAEPRAVNAAFGSFEIDLALDVLTLEGLPGEVVTWQRQALLEYQNDVLDFDFHAEGPLPSRLNSATEDQLRAIFGPVLQIANNSSYVAQSRVSITQPFKSLRPVPPRISKAIIPPKPKSINEEQADTEFANVLLQWRKGQELDQLTTRQLRQAIIAMTTGDETSATIGEFRTSNGQTIVLTEPIDITLSKTGSFIEARYDPLGISELGTNAVAALEAVNRDLANLYARFQLMDRSDISAGSSTKLHRIMDAFAQLIGE